MGTDPVSFGEALRLVLDSVPPPRVEHVPLARSNGRILARDVQADRDIPPFDRAAMDGYAIRVREGFDSRRRLPIVTEVAAGTERPRRLAVDTCVRIWTGAPVPEGAQGIIPIEKTREEADWVELEGPFDPESPRRFAIAGRGEDARRGAVVACEGEVITPANLAVLAAVGCDPVPAFAEADVALAVTGHEVVPCDGRPGPTQIRNTNDAVVAAIAGSTGVRSLVRLGIVEDEITSLRRALRRGLNHDLLVVTGGVSAGRLDLVPSVLEDLGVKILIHRVAMRPGKPFLFGVLERNPARGRSKAAKTAAGRGRGARGRGPEAPTFVFGLPGNPVSVLVTAIEFLVPFLRAFRGQKAVEIAPVAVRLEEDVVRAGGLTHFLSCAVRADARGQLWARVVPIRGSGDFTSVSRANALLHVPGDGLVRKAGDVLPADPIPGVWPNNLALR